MSNLAHKLDRQRARQQRVRAKLTGTSKRPRLSVFMSSRHVSAQLIDDEKQITLASATTVGKKSLPSSGSERAALIGAEIAKSAQNAKVKQVIFDRRHKLFHGRIKDLAEAARKEGLEF